MDASSWLVNSDSSNQSDVLRAVLTVLQQNNPDLKGLALANPGGEFYNVNEAKIRKLKDLYFNYKPPIYTKRDIHGLNQAYAKYQHSIHQARVQTVARDNILRGEQLLSSPAASDILNPQISNLCLESGQKVYGLDPTTGLCFPRPLEFQYEISYNLFSSGTVPLLKRL